MAQLLSNWGNSNKKITPFKTKAPKRSKKKQSNSRVIKGFSRISPESYKIVIKGVKCHSINSEGTIHNESGIPDGTGTMMFDKPISCETKNGNRVLELNGKTLLNFSKGFCLTGSDRTNKLKKLTSHPISQIFSTFKDGKATGLVYVFFEKNQTPTQSIDFYEVPTLEKSGPKSNPFHHKIKDQTDYPKKGSKKRYNCLIFKTSAVKSKTQALLLKENKNLYKIHKSGHENHIKVKDATVSLLDDPKTKRRFSGKISPSPDFDYDSH